MKLKTKHLIIALIGTVVLTEVIILAANHFGKDNRTVIHHKVAPIVHPDGVDVSHHQGKIDWQRLSQDTSIQFAYIKATEGTSWKDNRFERNVREARKYGIKVGAYHLLSLNTSPETQVDNYCRLVSKSNVDLIPAIDIEAKLMNHRHSDRLKKYTLDVCRLMTARFGRKPLIYTSVGVYNRFLYPEFEDYYLWISSYRRRCPTLKGKTHTNIWQYTENGKLDHYDKPIDLNCLVNSMTVEDLIL